MWLAVLPPGLWQAIRVGKPSHTMMYDRSKGGGATAAALPVISRGESMPDLEKKLTLIAESQELAPDDKLTRLLEGEEEELSLDELDFVSAAGGGADYQRFLDRLNGKR